MQNNIDPRLIEAQFLESLRREGITPKKELSPLVMDGQIHRFAVEGDRGGEKSGAYKIFPDECPNWFIQDFHKGNQMIHCVFDMTSLSRQERTALYQNANTPEQQAEREAKKAEETRREEQKKRRALAYALREYDEAFACNVHNHPYIMERFINKSIPVNLFMPLWHFECRGGPIPSNAIKRAHVKTMGPLGSELKPEKLIIPITNALTREFQSLQGISHEPDDEGKYQKGFYPNTSPQGGCYELIPPNSETAPIVYLCEGVCTGIAVVVLTRGQFPVFCAMTCGNLLNVAHKLRQRYPKKKIIIMADNDKATELKRGINPGLKAAHEVLAEGFADRVIPASITGRDYENIDWYDILAERSISHVYRYNR